MCRNDPSEVLGYKRQGSDSLMLATAWNTTPLAEMDARVPWLQGPKRFNNLGLELQQSLSIGFIRPDSITAGCEAWEESDHTSNTMEWQWCCKKKTPVGSAHLWIERRSCKGTTLWERFYFQAALQYPTKNRKPVLQKTHSYGHKSKPTAHAKMGNSSSMRGKKSTSMDPTDPLVFKGSSSSAAEEKGRLSVRFQVLKNV